MVIQWTNYRKKSATGDVFNFQIRLNQNGNSIAVVYNAFTVNGTNSTPQVGIRGASSADFNNRTVGASQTWATSIAGTANTSSCFLRSAKFPANGQTYTWTPLNCTISTFPYNEDFSATLNSCWSISQVSGTGLWTMATSINYPDLIPVVTLNPQSGTHLAKFDSYNYATGTVSRLKTSTFNFTSLTSPSVEFYMAQDGQYTNLDMMRSRHPLMEVLPGQLYHRLIIGSMQPLRHQAGKIYRLFACICKYKQCNSGLSGHQPLWQYDGH
ncbi:MAG: hypothetical protein IPH45_16640 [Bacteroidales bacterium]|nr:hypothetical protein [Bacteroidales bacterium]